MGERQSPRLTPLFVKNRPQNMAFTRTQALVCLYIALIDLYIFPVTLFGYRTINSNRVALYIQNRKLSTCQ